GGTVTPGEFHLPGESSMLGGSATGDQKVSVTVSVGQIYARNGHTYASLSVGMDYPPEENPGATGSVSISAGYIDTQRRWSFSVADIDSELVGWGASVATGRGSFTVSVAKSLPNGNFSTEYGIIDPPSDSWGIGGSTGLTWQTTP